METTDFDWLNGNWASDLELLPSDSPRAGTAAEPASQAGERVDQTGSELALPLLRLSGWEADKQYDKNNPVCIHYDLLHTRKTSSIRPVGLVEKAALNDSLVLLALRSGI
ncbi:hypothetical protein BGZ57DRAFT_926385 [Hyaloscypha finlandica]|nr:hypothetical protein BGZ57DRAFT_926385 [Hyaloscypha finlandica]